MMVFDKLQQAIDTHNRPMMTATERVKALIVRLENLREEMLELEANHQRDVKEVSDSHTKGAKNLLHYVALRRHDLHETQIELAELGLSSLGRCESWSLTNIEAVLCILRILADPQHASYDILTQGIGTSLQEGRNRIDFNAEQLLGPAPERRVRIMVTMPGVAADDYLLVRSLLAGGMDCMRINCAHDNPEIWRKIISQLCRARLELNRPCQICMDLAGPNPRTRLFEKFDTSRKFIIGDSLRLVTEPSGHDDLPEIGCTCPEILADLKTGERLFIDDGKFEAVVRQTGSGMAVLELTRVSPKGKKIKTEKGINVPDTLLHLPSLTDFDLEVLPFVVENADIVGLSFVRHPDDVLQLQKELVRLGGEQLGILLKIETLSAFRLFPRLLLAAMRSPKIGVMIARGDMAIECGYERLAEVQEEILWFCEAAFLPVVWATEVLKSFVKTGMPGRGEITDAAMGGRAECVMLNKGPFIVEAVRTLDNILLRMKAHQNKKRSMLRRLSVSEAFLDWDREHFVNVPESPDR
jgi:pyruvate kinase